MKAQRFPNSRKEDLFKNQQNKIHNLPLIFCQVSSLELIAICFVPVFVALLDIPGALKHIKI